VRPHHTVVFREWHERVTTPTASTLAETARAPDGEFHDKLLETNNRTKTTLPPKARGRGGFRPAPSKNAQMKVGSARPRVRKMGRLKGFLCH
jgi:hypothetical protein